jgi:hypothetical protein
MGRRNGGRPKDGKAEDAGEWAEDVGEREECWVQVGDEG